MSQSEPDLRRHLELGAFAFCPICFHAVAQRQNKIGGNDICEKGHVFPSSRAVKLGDMRLSTKEEQGK